jgi:gamma-glutamyltranspeptidase/glutathione hydrolase
VTEAAAAQRDGGSELAVARAEHGVIACVESLAAEAGAEMLRRGGNATDAAIATAFAQGVVDPIYCGIAGGFHGIFHDSARGVTEVVSAGGRAPLAASDRMWELVGRRGALWEVEGNRNRLGYEASMVPGFVRGAADALERFGSRRISWREAIEPAIALAEDGFSVYPYLYRLWMPRTERMRNFLESLDGPTVLGRTHACSEIYLRPDGSVYEIGEILVQRDYAQTLRLLADRGPDEFYEGEIARRIADDFAQHEGLLSAEDLRRYQADVAPPISTQFHDLTALTEPAPTIGAVTLEILNILEGWDLGELDWNSAPYLDRLARAFHLAFRDRMSLLGDPDFVDVPEEKLLSKEYAAELRDRIDRGVDHELRDRAEPAQARQAAAAETTHVSVLDTKGNAAAITHSLGMSSGVVTSGLGFQHNCHMVMFDPSPGKRNSIAPWKRPITGGGPTLFMRDGRVRLAIGSPGGALKATALIQALLNVETFGMPMQTAVSVDRIHAEDEPATLIVEPHFDPRVLEQLAALGQRIRFDWYTARLAGVLSDESGQLAGGTDPRGDRGLAVV